MIHPTVLRRMAQIPPSQKPRQRRMALYIIGLFFIVFTAFYLYVLIHK